MKHKKKSQKVNKKNLTPEQLAELEAKLETKRQEEVAHKEKEKYEKYVSELREQNYRSALLLDPIKAIGAMIRAHKKLKRNALEMKKWNDYLSCNSLPNVNDPPAVKHFIYRWKLEIEEDIQNYFSWALNIDERSILTQDRSKKKQCFWKLYDEQPLIGDRYVPRIEQCLSLLNSLENVLHQSIKPELLEIKAELRKQLSDVIEQFSYRVLINVEYDMVHIDGYLANHNYKSKSFCSSLWSSRPVPQVSENWKSIGVTEMELHELDATIMLPNNLETDGFSYRGLLLYYDHYSDMAPSYNLNVPIPPIPDLRTANEMEWNKREEIMHEKLDEMRANRARWEQKQDEKLLKEEEEKKKKPRGGIGGPKPPPKAIKPQKIRPGPGVVTQLTVVDVTEEVLKYEEDVFMQQKAAVSPESLNLTENEINLREYQIIGGVYLFHYLIRPQQYTKLKHQFLYKLDTRPVLKHANFLANRENDMIEIRIKLSANVNWWFTPVVCYWQQWEESDEFLALSPELQDFHNNYDAYVTKLEGLLFSNELPKPHYDIIKCINDFHLNTIPDATDLQNLIHNYVIPRMPITFKFQIELDAEKELLRKEEHRLKEIEMEVQETNQRRRAVFDSEMKEYLMTIQDGVKRDVTKMKEEFEEFYIAERHRMVNFGENELQINRFLKHRREEDEGKIRDFINDAMSKYQDYVDVQYKQRILAFELQAASTEIVPHSQVIKKAPRDLFPTRPRQFALKLVDGDTVYNFDVPNEENPPGYADELNKNPLLSTFLRYLTVLFDKNKPFFKESPKIDELEAVSIKSATKSTKSEFKHKTGAEKKSNRETEKHSEPKLKKSKKTKTPLKKLTVAKKKPIKPKTAKKRGKTVSKQSSSIKSPRSVISKKSSRSRSKELKPISTPSKKTSSGSSKKKQKSGSSKKSSRSSSKKPARSKSQKKSPRTPSSRKTSKSPRKESKKRQKDEKSEGGVDADSSISLSEKSSELPHFHIRKARKDRILNLIPHFPGKWVQTGVKLLDFDVETREIKFQISRFGTFGFAMPKYCNFPLKYWEVYPNSGKKNSVLLKIIGNFAEIKIEINDKGYLVERIVPNNINFVPNSDAMEYRGLKNFLLDCGFNIFPDYDAGNYIQNISEKHRPMEQHTYYCIAQFSLSHYFRISEFNRLVNRRISVFEIYEVIENVPIPETFPQIMITPQRCNFVVASEVISKNGVKSIDLKLQPKQQDFYPDMYNLVLPNCNELSKRLHEQMKRAHSYNVARLLCAIRPLSFA